VLVDGYGEDLLYHRRDQGYREDAKEKKSAMDIY
jgi:hypothetical protein